MVFELSAERTAKGCRQLVPVQRQVPSGADVARATVLAVLDGPARNATDRYSAFSRDRRLLRSVRVEGDAATIDLAAVPDLAGIPPQCRSAEVRQPLVRSLTRTGRITTVRVTLQGSAKDFTAALGS